MSEDNNKLYFVKSERHFREMVSDIAVSGPSPNGLLHISFLVDRVDLVSQTKTVVTEDGEEVGYALTYSPDDSNPVREVLGQCELIESAYTGLVSAIIERMLTHGQKDTVDKLLAEKGYQPVDTADEEDDGA